MLYFFIDCKTNAVEIVKHIRKLIAYKDFDETNYESLNKFKKNKS